MELISANGAKENFCNHPFQHISGIGPRAEACLFPENNGQVLRRLLPTFPLTTILSRNWLHINALNHNSLSIFLQALHIPNAYLLHQPTFLHRPDAPSQSYCFGHPATTSNRQTDASTEQNYNQLSETKTQCLFGQGSNSVWTINENCHPAHHNQKIVDSAPITVRLSQQNKNIAQNSEKRSDNYCCLIYNGKGKMIALEQLWWLLSWTTPLRMTEWGPSEVECEISQVRSRYTSLLFFEYWHASTPKYNRTAEFQIGACGGGRGRLLERRGCVGLLMRKQGNSERRNEMWYGIPSTHSVRIKKFFNRLYET